MSSSPRTPEDLSVFPSAEALAQQEQKVAQLVAAFRQLQSSGSASAATGVGAWIGRLLRTTEARKKQALELYAQIAVERELLGREAKLRYADVIPRPAGLAPGVLPSARNRPVTVVIQLGRDFDAFRSCLAATIRFTSSKHRLLLLDRDGGSPEASALAAVMAERLAHVTYERLAGEVSEVAASNLGLATVEQGDVVLLDSECRVTQGWLNHLRETAYASKAHATASALTTGEEPFSVGTGDDGLSELAAVVAEQGIAAPKVLGGNDRCLYLRRDACAAVGYLDEVATTTTTAAVADFCQRAVASGWSHAVDVRVVVDQRPVFGAALVVEALSGQSQVWEALEPVRQGVRKGLAERRAERSAALSRLTAEAGDRPVLMLVVFVGGGGTPKTNIDLARGLCAHWRVLVLEMTPDEWLLSEVAESGKTLLASRFFRTLFSLGDDLPAAHDDCLRRWVAQHGVKVVHFRHWLGSAPELIGSAKQAGAGVVVSLHDFYSVCPSLMLLDASKQCCLGDCSLHAAEIQGVKDCSAVESWPGQGAGITLWNDYVHTWRQRVRQVLAKVDAIVTMTEVVQEITCRWLPELAGKFHIIEHGRDFSGAAVDAAVFPAADQPVRLVFLGEATFVKGADFFVELAQAALEQGRPWEFHMLGKLFIQAPTLANLTCHGAYERDALPETLAQLQPTFILLPSRFPETYCHTLTEAWSCGIPVLAHDLGALHERILKHGAGWLLPDLNTQTWLAQVDQLLTQPDDYEKRRLQACGRPYRPVAAMTQEFLHLYQSILSTSN